MDKLILSDNMKVVACPKCGKILQKSITTVSEFVCPCKYKFDAVVQGDFVMYYNPSDGKSKELAKIFFERFSALLRRVIRI